MVSRWELGFNVPSLYYAEKLAAYFGVSLGALMGREDEEKPAADPGELADGVRARLRLLSFFMFAPALDRKSTRLNSSHSDRSRMPSSA